MSGQATIHWFVGGGVGMDDNMSPSRQRKWPMVEMLSSGLTHVREAYSHQENLRDGSVGRSGAAGYIAAHRRDCIDRETKRMKLAYVWVGRGGGDPEIDAEIRVDWHLREERKERRKKLMARVLRRAGETDENRKQADILLMMKVRAQASASTYEHNILARAEELINAGKDASLLLAFVANMQAGRG